MKTRQEIESRRRGKRKMIWTVVFASLFAAMLTALILFLAFYEIPLPEEEEKPLPEVLAGEDIYRGNPIAYPIISQTNINRITVSNNNKDGKYTFVKSSEAGGSYIFTYQEDGEVKIYYPSIYGATGIDYTDFYATETGDGYNAVARVDYLLASLQTPYFGERIELSSDPAERARQLEIYGFGGEGETVVTFDYLDTNTGSDGTHRIVIGGRTINGKGYYFTVDDREYVYSSSSAYFEYAMLGFYSYVNTALVAEGLPGDSTYEPLLTPEFTHYKNTLHTVKEGEEAPVVVKNSTLVIKASALDPTTPQDFLSNPSLYPDGHSGYPTEVVEDMTVDLYSGVEKNKVLLALTDGTRRLGVLESPLVYTVPVSFNTAKEVAFLGADSVVYDYTIVEIEAVVTDKEDVTAPGTDVREGDRIRVAYYATADGVFVTPVLSHAYLDLNASALSPEIRTVIASKNVGKLDTPLSFTVNYTKDNVITTRYETAITEIIAITDKDGNAMKTVTADTKTVMYRYALFIDGVISSDEKLTEIDFTKHTTEDAVAVKNQLIGKSIGTGHRIVTDDGVAYGEVMQHFTLYTVRELSYFTTREEIISFSFLNDSDRDPFYGESIYKNNTDGFELYGLNNNYCEQVLKLLGGLGESSNMSTGLKAESIVSVGITPEKLEDYGCYAHTVVFKLPRGIETYTNSNDDEAPLHYIAAEELTFELYISDIKEDGKRIVASSLYDVIARVSDDYFFFVDKTFQNFWARDNILMLSVDNVVELKLDLMMDKVYGSYKMSVVHDDAYRVEDGYQIGGAPPENYYDVFDYVTVNVAPMGECFDTELSRLVSSLDKGYVSLETLYQHTVKDEDKLASFYPDSYGTTYFKEFMLGLFYIDQEGYVEDSEKADVLKEENLLMRLAIKIDRDRDGDTAEEDEYYTYEFYHFPDANKVLIRLYLADSEGNMIGNEVSDFYISRLAFKRIVSTYVSLLNGREFVLGEDYPEVG